MIRAFHPIMLYHKKRKVTMHTRTASVKVARKSLVVSADMDLTAHLIVRGHRGGVFSRTPYGANLRINKDSFARSYSFSKKLKESHMAALTSNFSFK